MGAKQHRSTLFVCSANQCRSPMAEALLRMRLEQSGISDNEWRVASAGCWAYPQMPATSKAVTAVSDMGADLHNHSAQAVSADLLEDFTLILCMENGHVDFIKRHFPEHASHVFLLSEMIDEEFEIDDPIGMHQQDYRDTADQILGLISEGLEKIQSLS